MARGKGDWLVVKAARGGESDAACIARVSIWTWCMRWCICV